MAVQLSFEICQKSNCKGATFVETTGVYSTSNTTGWGTPNEATSDATAATLTIESYDSETNTYSTLSSTNVFTSSFPTTNSAQELFLDSTYFGEQVTDPIPDGIYVFTYSVTTSTTTYTQKRKVHFFCEAKCCVYGMIADLEPDDCDCHEEQEARALKAWGFLKGLQYAANCRPDSEFNEILDLLERLCAYQDCSTCN